MSVNVLQQGDVKVFQTIDDGNINVEGGIIEMGGGLDTAAYLSLFGGNENDSGSDGNSLTWWGNLSENNPARQYRSETQHLLRSIPTTTDNLKRIQDAAIRDLQWMIDESVASSITVLATMPGLNRVNLQIDILAQGEESSFNFTENWRSEV